MTKTKNALTVSMIVADSSSYVNGIMTEEAEALCEALRPKQYYDPAHYHIHTQGMFKDMPEDETMTIDGEEVLCIVVIGALVGLRERIPQLVKRKGYARGNPIYFSVNPTAIGKWKQEVQAKLRRGTLVIGRPFSDVERELNL